MSDNPAKESLRQEQKEQRKLAKATDDAALNKALKDTFPASDPIAAEAPIKPGGKKGAPRSA